MTFQQKIKTVLLRKAIKICIHALFKTCRMTITGFEHVQDAREKQAPIIYAYWHRHILATIYRFKNTGARPLISLSADGELVSQVAIAFGMNPVRGSSSRGGARAFLELANTIKENNSEVLITADGPKGPPCQIKDGTILLAQKTGSVVIPISWHATREKIFEKTWDRFKIPLPFSTITYTYGKPIVIPADLSRNDYESVKEKLTESINQLERI
ncbi:MAG: lysophospholipid acyltransferase family protein [Candidatus Omnitrophota bacterium]